nr:hypothetical protein [uncultured Mediterranean phage uvMED]
MTPLIVSKVTLSGVIGMIPKMLQPFSVTSITVGTSKSIGASWRYTINPSMHHSTVRLLNAAILDSPRENSRAESVLAALAFICWIINFWLSSAALLLIAMSLAIKPRPMGSIDVKRSNTLHH